MSLDHGLDLSGALERRNWTPPPPPVRPAWYHDPVLFATTCINWPDGKGLADYQADVLTQLATRRRVAQSGPHGLGKTTTAALAVHWFALGSELAQVDWKAVTTAGAWRQLERFLWPEIKLWAGRLKWDTIGLPVYNARHEMLALNLKLKHGSAFAVASDEPSLIEGAHAQRILYVFDESKAIKADTFDAAEGAFSTGDAYALASSTPGAPSGRFYDIHQRKPGYEDWATRHVTKTEVIAAGQMSVDWADQRRRQWGVDSAIYANRVLGEFHADDTDSVIPLGWVEAANERWRLWEDAGFPELPGRRFFGVDVARGGSDRTIIAARQGHGVYPLERHSKADTMATVGHVAAKLTHPFYAAIVDVIGVGAGVVDRLREQGKPTIAFNGSASPTGTDRSGEIIFLNRRAQAWWHLRELLDPAYDPQLCLPPDDELTGDLVGPRWWFTSSGKVQLEAKDDVRARIGRSPDAGDAVVYVCFDHHDDTADALSVGAVPWSDRVDTAGAAVPWSDGWG